MVEVGDWANFFMYNKVERGEIIEVIDNYKVRIKYISFINVPVTVQREIREIKVFPRIVKNPFKTSGHELTRSYCFNAIPDNEECFKCIEKKAGSGKSCHNQYKSSLPERLKKRHIKKNRTIDSERKRQEWNEYRKTWRK